MISSLVMNNILRYEGKANFAMIGLVTGGVLNIVLDPIFMFGLALAPPVQALQRLSARASASASCCPCSCGAKPSVSSVLLPSPVKHGSSA